MTDDELQEVIDFCDKDGRGEILLEDFCSVLLAAQAQCVAAGPISIPLPRPSRPTLLAPSEPRTAAWLAFC